MKVNLISLLAFCLNVLVNSQMTVVGQSLVKLNCAALISSLSAGELRIITSGGIHGSYRSSNKLQLVKKCGKFLATPATLGWGQPAGV